MKTYFQGLTLGIFLTTCSWLLAVYFQVGFYKTAYNDGVHDGWWRATNGCSMYDQAVCLSKKECK